MQYSSIGTGKMPQNSLAKLHIEVFYQELKIYSVLQENHFQNMQSFAAQRYIREGRSIFQGLLMNHSCRLKKCETVSLSYLSIIEKSKFATVFSIIILFYLLYVRLFFVWSLNYLHGSLTDL